MYWVPRLLRGFWVDEAGSYWLVRKGLGQVWQQMQIFSGQSVIHAHLSSLVASSGPYKELWLRLPSVVAALIAAWLLFKLTEEVAGPKSGFIAVILFCCAGAIVETATNARPYALGMPIIMASFWSLRKWVHTQRTAPLVVYCLCSPLVVYVHYLFGIIFVAQILYLAIARRAGHRFSANTMMAAGGLVLAAAMPLTWQVLTMAQKAGIGGQLRSPTLGISDLLSAARSATSSMFTGSPRRPTRAKRAASSGAARGVTFECPDLNLPSFETLTVTRMIEQACEAIARAPDGPIALVGSSLGGFVALYAASRRDAGEASVDRSDPARAGARVRRQPVPAIRRPRRGRVAARRPP